jgi:hypothetical protein
MRPVVDENVGGNMGLRRNIGGENKRWWRRNIG